MDFAWLLLIGSAAVGHSVIGFDHYVPLSLVSKNRRWSLVRTSLMSLLGAIFHLGTALILLGVSSILGAHGSFFQKLDLWRASATDVVLIALGFMMAMTVIRSRPPWNRIQEKLTGRQAPWLALLAMGPCEPMAPLIALSAPSQKFVSMIVFMAITTLTMMGMTVITSRAMKKATMPAVTRFVPALAGLALIFVGASDLSRLV